MISKRNDYSELLDNLRMLSEECHIDAYGNVINKNGNKEINEKTIIDTKFYYMYCVAYKELIESIELYPQEMTKEFIIRALSDYNVFNSFINNCVIEYGMYKGVGTGNIMYFPCQTLADYFFKNYGRTRELLNYLSHEIVEVFGEKENKGAKK